MKDFYEFWREMTFWRRETTFFHKKGLRFCDYCDFKMRPQCTLGIFSMQGYEMIFRD